MGRHIGHEQDAIMMVNACLGRDGTLSDYRWSVERKHILLEKEAAA
jgi:hypothetical protein